MVQTEIDANRAAICSTNFPSSSCIVGDLAKRVTQQKIKDIYRSKSAQRLALLVVTPPCQGMSSSNPGRGKIKDSDADTRDKRNLLLLKAVPIIKDLQPRIIIVENVPYALTKKVRQRSNSQALSLYEIFKSKLDNYKFFSLVVQMADYGVPQMRRRAIIVAVHKEESWLEQMEDKSYFPLPKTTHAEASDNGFAPWITISDWFKEFKYPSLDAVSKEAAVDQNDTLHHVPSYSETRYSWIADIPQKSGRNAYSNSNCRNCGKEDVEINKAYCNYCGEPLLNRPHVKESNGSYRLIKGFHSSYRRMPADVPARTITTNSSHMGSDFKIHPWENRVLSMRECAELQTVPRFYDWSHAIDNDRKYVIRQVVGEALPPWFTYQHGLVLKKLLNSKRPNFKNMKLAFNGKKK